MECRLCLCSASPSYFVPVHPYSEILEKHVWRFSEQKVTNQDTLPDTICLSCECNIKSLIDFKKICCANDETARLRLTKCFEIKVEEVILDDFIFDDERQISGVGKNKSKRINSKEEKNLNIDERKLPVKDGDNLNSPADSNAEEKQFKCKVCSKCFCKRSEIKRHMKCHTGVKPFKCETCSKCFARNSEIKIHMKYHTGEREFKCETCPKRFMTNGDLKKHIASNHTGEKPYKCELCAKCFVTKHNLKLHVMSIHGDEKPFKCEMCSKCFIRNRDLKLHERSHTGEKPFKCEFCSKWFIRNGDIKRHMKCHTGDKPFKCEMCSKCFIKSSDLKTHVKLNKVTGTQQLVCEVCSQCFVTKCEFKLHMKSNHTKEKPKCKICSKVFVKPWEFTPHMNVHNGIKPFKCEMCSVFFVKRNDLKIHMNSHTEITACIEMYCKLCLCSTSAENSIPSESYSHLLEKHVWSGHQPQVKIHNKLPDRICSSCELNLKSFIQFKHTCIKSDETARSRTTEL